MMFKTYIEYSTEIKPKLEKWLSKHGLTDVAQCFVYDVKTHRQINAIEIAGLDAFSFPSGSTENIVIKDGKKIGHWRAVDDRSLRGYGRLVIPMYS